MRLTGPVLHRGIRILDKAHLSSEYVTFLNLDV